MNIEIITAPNEELKKSGFVSLKSYSNVLEAIRKTEHNNKLNICTK